jgi:tRNA(fMet)-specific endonuclease VapC
VLDTNAVSALLKGEPGAVDRLKSLRRTDVAVPQPVIAEIEYGIARLPRSKRRTRLAMRFEIVAAEIGRAPWNDEVSERFGAIKASLEKRGSMIADFDIAIAAHALAHRAVLVTADRAHMARISGLEIEDWAAT